MEVDLGVAQFSQTGELQSELIIGVDHLGWGEREGEKKKYMNANRVEWSIALPTGTNKLQLMRVPRGTVFKSVNTAVSLNTQSTSGSHKPSDPIQSATVTLS